MSNLSFSFSSGSQKKVSRHQTSEDSFSSVRPHCVFVPDSGPTLEAQLSFSSTGTQILYFPMLSEIMSRHVASGVSDFPQRRCGSEHLRKDDDDAKQEVLLVTLLHFLYGRDN